MRIYYVNKTRLYDNMPSTVFSMLNAYSFAENGADVTIFLKKPIHVTAYDFETFFNLKKPDNFQIQTIGDTKFGFRSNKIFYHQVNQWIKKQPKPDVIFTRDPGYLPSLAQLKKQMAVKTFYQSHNFYLDTSLQPDQKKINQKKFHKYEKKYLPKLDGLFTLNNPQKNLYQNYIGIPVHAVIPGLQKIYPQQDNFTQKKIVYTGSLQMKKGVDVLLRSFAKVDDKDARLILIGGRHEREILPVKQLAANLGISNQIEITGWLSFDDVQKKLQKATVGIIPLKNTFYNQYLTAPSKLFDYIAHGIPVIASDLPAIRDIDRKVDSIIFKAPENIPQLTAEIEHILKNRDRYLSFTEKSHALAQHYLWKICGQRMLEKMLMA